MSYLRVVFWLFSILFVLAACVFPISVVEAKESHTVREGQTLGGIAKRYGVSIDALCKANGIRRTDTIRPGQRLVIPKEQVASEEPRNKAPDATVGKKTEDRGQQRLEVPGVRSAYYYEPTGRGRLGLRPVFMVLHGRGGDPEAFCARWAPIVRPMGWLLCPIGPHKYGSCRSWNNDWGTGRRLIQASHQALRAKYGGRVQLYGNTLVGFSEGAFVGMNVGVRDPRAFNRWLILAADDRYWGAGAPELLSRAGPKMRRVYLITGKQDGVHAGTLRTQSLLRKARVTVRVSDPSDMGHVVDLEGKRSMYQAALFWLNQG